MLTGMVEAVFFIVFLLPGTDMPPGNTEGPYIVPGFTSLEQCAKHVDDNVEVLIGNEAKEHGVDPQSVVIFHACRASTQGQPA